MGVETEICFYDSEIPLLLKLFYLSIDGEIYYSVRRVFILIELISGTSHSVLLSSRLYGDIARWGV